MPKTKFQSVAFTLIMVFCMVYCMTTYTIALKFRELSYTVFSLAIKEMWIEFIVVFLLIFFVISKSAQKIASRFISPEIEKPIFKILAIQCLTVCFIVPSITLFATLYHNGLTINWFSQWTQLIMMCFPVAFCLQIFFVGPFVRTVFQKIF